MPLSRVEVLARISGFLPGFVMAASNEIPKNPLHFCGVQLCPTFQKKASQKRTESRQNGI